MKTPIYTGIFQSDLEAAGYKITGLPTPLADDEAANKAYVDAHSGGGGGGGSDPLITVNVKDAPYSAAGNGVTDDTAAIQAAVNAVAALGGGVVFFPPGTYLVGGALQDTSARNSQILLPIVSDTIQTVTIQLLGALQPPRQFNNGAVFPSGAPYSVIKSTLTGASGTASFIATKNTSTWYGNVQLIVKNIIVAVPADPSFTVFNCYEGIGPQFYNVLIYSGTVSASPEPTHSNSYGIKLAPLNHSAGQTVRRVDIWGFYNGLLDGELAENDLNLWSCKNGVVVPFTHHLSTFIRLGIYGYQKAIVSDGSGTHYLRVLSYDNEHGNGSAWTDRVYDVDDPSNLLYGDLKWVSILSGVGNDHSFLKNGGANFHCNEFGTEQADTLYIGSDARLSSLVNGVKLEVRNSGTGTWVEATRYSNP